MNRSRVTWAASVLCLVSACGASDQALSNEDEPSQAANDASTASDASTSVATDAGSQTSAASDPECDLNGLWIARQQTVNVALGLPQTANNWYFYELAQDGENVEVVDHFDCGIEVLGTVRVQLRPQTIEALLTHNLQAGRKGKIRRSGAERCDFEMERFWSVRGAVEATYIPDRKTPLSSSELAAQIPLPSKEAPTGAEDWDMDGELGIAWVITGVASGERHSIQRDYTDWRTDADFTIKPSRNWTRDFSLRSYIGSEEVVFAASSPTLAGSGVPDASAKHRVTFHFLGRNKSASEAKRILKAKPLDTCIAVREALPALEL